MLVVSQSRGEFSLAVFNLFPLPCALGRFHLVYSPIEQLQMVDNTDEAHRGRQRVDECV